MPLSRPQREPIFAQQLREGDAGTGGSQQPAQKAGAEQAEVSEGESLCTLSLPLW